MNLNQPPKALADVSLRKNSHCKRAVVALTVSWSVGARSSAHGHRILNVAVDDVLNQLWPCSVLLRDEIWSTWVIWQGAKSSICAHELFDWCAEVDIHDRSISICCLARSQLLRAHSVGIPILHPDVQEAVD